MTEHDPNLIRNYQGSAGEVPIDAREIFYSRTDSRGVILEANGVFRRISGYDWSELKGAPHRLVRHPDMPKGVFRLYWDLLSEGRDVVAYVKNRSKDGRYYWVMALACPVDGGYLSVRLKPNSDFLPEVQQIYATLLQEEKDGLTPEQSGARLRELIAEQGFETYRAFMTEALSRELRARRERIGVEQDQIQRRFAEMHATVLRIGEETGSMTSVIRAIRTVPMNMRIIASRLESAGGPISAISVNYGSMLDEMATWVRTFSDGPKSTYARILEAVRRGQYLAGASALFREMAVQFEEDIGNAGHIAALVDEQRMLDGLAARFTTEADSALKLVETEVTRLGRSVLDMKRYVTGLSSTRMMCKIESASLHEAGDSSLSGIVDQLDAGQNEIEEGLSRVIQLNSMIEGHAGMLRSLM